MKKGFTLIELLVTFVIIGLVMIIGIQTYQNITLNTQETKYEYYRQILMKASDVLLESRKSGMQSGNCYYIQYTDIINSGKVKENEITCTGSLQLTKSGRKFTYNDANLECKDSNNTVIKKKIANVDSTCIKANIN